MRERRAGALRRGPRALTARRSVAIHGAMSAARTWHVLVRLALACPALVLVGAAKSSPAYAATAKPAASALGVASLRQPTARAVARPVTKIGRDAKLQSRRATRISAPRIDIAAPLYLFHCALLI